MSRVFLSLLAFTLFCSPLLAYAASPALNTTSTVVCHPSLTTICVSHNGTDFILQGGLSNHSQIMNPTPHPALDFIINVPYIFQLTNSGNFTAHPLIITTSSLGGCQGNCMTPNLTYTSNQIITNESISVGSEAGQMLNFKATNPSDIGKMFYYQSEYDYGMGNTITIVNSSYVIYNNTNSSSIISPYSTLNSTSSTGVAGYGYNATMISSTGAGIIGGGGIVGGSGTGTTGTSGSTNPGGVSKNGSNKLTSTWIVGIGAVFASISLLLIQ